MLNCNTGGKNTSVRKIGSSTIDLQSIIFRKVMVRVQKLKPDSLKPGNIIIQYLIAFHPFLKSMAITHFFFLHSVSVKLPCLALNQQFSCSCFLIKVLFPFIIFARNSAFPALVLGTRHETSFSRPCKHSLA